MQKFEITNAESGAAFAVQIRPGAGANQMQGKIKDIVHIDLVASADKSAIDEALVSFLANRLRVNEEQIALAGGKTMEKRVVIVIGLTPNEIETRLFA